MVLIKVADYRNQMGHFHLGGHCTETGGAKSKSVVTALWSPCATNTV